MDDTAKHRLLHAKRGFRQRVVVCGSMAFYSSMLELRGILHDAGIPAIVPEAEDAAKTSLSCEQYEMFKARISRRYLVEIRNPRTVAVLAANYDKHDIQDYIGPNTFAEIAVAFVNRKRIYLLQQMPEMYKDELSAWGAIELRGSLSGLIESYKSLVALHQLSLFEV